MKIISLRFCNYHSKIKQLSVSAEHFGGFYPEEFEIVSHHTGEIMKFVPDVEADIAAEFCDGLQRYYKPVGKLPKIKNVVVYAC